MARSLLQPRWQSGNYSLQPKLTMPDWLNKLKAVAVPVAKVTEAVAPGPAGKIAGVVDQALSDKSQPDPDVIKQLTLRN